MEKMTADKESICPSYMNSFKKKLYFLHMQKPSPVHLCMQPVSGKRKKSASIEALD